MRTLFGLALGAGLILGATTAQARCGGQIKAGTFSMSAGCFEQIEDSLAGIEGALSTPGYELLVHGSSGMHSIAMSSKDKCHGAIRAMIETEQPGNWLNEDIKEEQRANLGIDGKIYHVRSTGFTCLAK